MSSPNSSLSSGSPTEVKPALQKSPPTHQVSQKDVFGDDYNTSSSSDIDEDHQYNPLVNAVFGTGESQSEEHQQIMAKEIQKSHKSNLLLDTDEEDDEDGTDFAQTTSLPNRKSALLPMSSDDDDRSDDNAQRDSGDESKAGAKVEPSNIDSDDSDADLNVGNESGRRVKNEAVAEEGEDGNEDDDEDEEMEDERQIRDDVPLISADLGRAIKLVKVTNFLSVEQRPFDPATYEDEGNEDETVDEQGSTRLKLKVENTVRWRVRKDPQTGEELSDPETGQPLRDSNARFVRWSDGTMSLHLGREIFDVHPVDIRSHDNYLYVRQGKGLQALGLFNQKLSFRPHSTDSFTHRKITLSMANRTNQKQGVKILPISGEDPEIERKIRLKKEEEKLKATLKRENQQRRLRERQVHMEMKPSFLESADDLNISSVNSIKGKYKQSSTSKAKKRVSDLYSSDSNDYESDTSLSLSKKKKVSKVNFDSSSEDSS